MTYARVRNRIKIINQKNEKRHILSVFRSNRSISASLIAPDGNMVKSISSIKVSTKGTPIEKARLTGAEIAKIAKGNKITTVVFDRNKYAYHGQVKALADGAREAGLKF